MQLQPALAVLDELRSLAAEDDSRLCAAKDRLAAAEAEVSAARSAFESASTRAEVSERVMRGAEELLAPDMAPHTSAPTSPHPGPAVQREPRTTAQEIMTFVRPRGRATRSEVVEHLRLTRPDLKPSSIRRRMSKLFADKKLVRVERGTYAPSPAAAEGDA
ncbi:hypothetical protein [Streptomyces zingiberis]|uniref:Uncharacterized protein n=1 Tax=Streptomyces zingiberis TaxID=2053010 RepID=A0ABX1BQ45_9ACTN|nr:hypothetical protein [Streptomyces zingiberis]NJP99848.1 hypothetical protein [Streptomyces zingiberis]